VLQTWGFLAEQRCIPLARIVSVAAQTAGRLKDKAAQVRKSAIQTLTILLKYNLFSPQLRLSEFGTKLAETAERFELLRLSSIW